MTANVICLLGMVLIKVESEIMCRDIRSACLNVAPENTRFLVFPEIMPLEVILLTYFLSPLLFLARGEREK